MTFVAARRRPVGQAPRISRYDRCRCTAQTVTNSRATSRRLCGRSPMLQLLITVMPSILWRPGRRSGSRRAAARVQSARAAGETVRVREPRLEIEYCTQCRWLMRAAWTAQELLTTFPRDLGEVALVPGVGGVFEVRLDGETLWSRKSDGFPEPAELKRLVRDRVAPERDLGHSDKR